MLINVLLFLTTEKCENDGCFALHNFQLYADKSTGKRTAKNLLQFPFMRISFLFWWKNAGCFFFFQK